jgi:hypothetical protein
LVSNFGHAESHTNICQLAAAAEDKTRGALITYCFQGISVSYGNDDFGNHLKTSSSFRLSILTFIHVNSATACAALERCACNIQSNMHWHAIQDKGSSECHGERSWSRRY